MGKAKIQIQAVEESLLSSWWLVSGAKQVVSKGLADGGGLFGHGWLDVFTNQETLSCFHDVEARGSLLDPNYFIRARDVHVPDASWFIRLFAT